MDAISGLGILFLGQLFVELSNMNDLAIKPYIFDHREVIFITLERLKRFLLPYFSH